MNLGLMVKDGEIDYKEMDRITRLSVRFWMMSLSGIRFH